MKPFLRLVILIFTLNLFHTSIYAQVLSMKSIALNIKKDLKTRVTGQNKNIIQNIYKKTGNKPLWIGKKNVKRTNSLLKALNNPLFNYKNKPFDMPSITRLFYMLDNNRYGAKKQAEIYARLDLILTSSMVRLVRFVIQGDVDWELVQTKLAALKESNDITADWEMKIKDFPNQNALISAIINNDIYNYLNYLIPMKKRYKNLVNLLEDYRTMPKFDTLDYRDDVLRLGDNSQRISEIKKRLKISGDFPKSAPTSEKFDHLLQKAVISYQKRYLLKVTGEVDKVTTYYLNKPLSLNIRSIITNLDKTKLYPKNFEKDYIEVNIPDFSLRYYQRGRKLFTKNLVVGRIDRPTPLFSDTMTYLVINPTWTIPDNLVKRDLIPVLKENPDYLKEKNIHAFYAGKKTNVSHEILKPYEKSEEPVPYRFTQYPGETNALGRVKFMFPNKYAVYIHDTDNKSLFKQRYKVYSSGCMRIEKPFELAKTLLKHSKKRYNIDKILATNKPKSIGLRKLIPVHMIYFTVYEENGLAHFRNDIYFYDKIIEESTEMNKKVTFTLPENSMVAVDKNAQPALSN